MFENYDDAFEVVAHPQAIDGEYAIRFRREPYAGVVIQLKSFALKDVEDPEVMEMTFEYNVLESSIPTETLELEPDFAKLVSGVVLNMYERTAEPEELEPSETVQREDGGTEITFDVVERQPHGEVVND